MANSWDLSAIEAAFAVAALDSSKWNSAMDAVAAATKSTGAILLPVTARPMPIVPISESLVPASEAYFKEGWAEHDIRYRAVPKLLRTGVMCDLDFTTPEEIKRDPYYQDFLGRAGLRWFGGVKVATGDDVWCISIQRSIEQGPFSSAELKMLSRLSGPLSSSAAAGQALSLARAEGALSAFDVSNVPAVLLARSGKVLRVNQAAGYLFRGDLAIDDGKIVSANPGSAPSLARALAALISTSSSSILMPPVVLPRSGLRRPLLAYAVRLVAVSRDALAPCQAIMVFADLDAKPRPRQDALCRCFGLTAAEARLAIALADGTGLDQAAEQLAIAKETARNQLKAIFAKTGTHRQSELVALLARL